MSIQIGRRTLVGAVAVAGAMAILAGCAQVQRMTEGGNTHRITLSGANEVPPVQTSASGTGTVTVNTDRTVTARITVTGMTATAAHIHEGNSTSNGPVIVPFVKEGDNTFVAPPGARMTEAQYAAYRAGNTYVNVHSARNPPGEIRAQLRGS